MRRITIVGLMGFVVTSAIGLAALRNANGVWAGAMLTLALGLFGVAVLGSICRSGRARYGWLGFAVFEGGYLLTSLGSWFAEAVSPRLLTTQALEHLHWRTTTVPSPSMIDLERLYAQRREILDRLNMERSRRDEDHPAVLRQRRSLSVVDSEITTIQGYPPVMTGFGMSERSVLPLATRAAFDSADRWKSLLPGAANRQPFLLAGHSLFGVLAGLLGSLVAIWFKDRDKCVGSASS